MRTAAPPVAVTVAVAALSLVAPSAPARADDAAIVETLKKLGAEVKTDKATGAVTSVLFKQPKEELTDEHYRLLGGLKSLREFTFYGDCLMTDAQAKLLSEAAALEKMAVNGTRLTDEGFKNLSGLKELKSLTIWHLGWKAGQAGKDDKTGRVKLTGAGLVALADLPKLESLNIGGSTVTDDGAASLAKVTQLKTLMLYHSWITDAGLAHIKTMKGLKGVNAGPQFSMRITDAGAAHLAELSDLESLEINETFLTWDGSLSKIAGLKKLKTIKFEKTDISDDDMAKLRAALPEAKINWTKPSADEVQKMRKEAERRRAEKK